MNRYKARQKWIKEEAGRYWSPDARFKANRRKDGKWNLWERIKYGQKKVGAYLTLADCQEAAEQRELQERLEGIGAEPSEWECPICSADYGPSDSHPWHWPDEDCRAVREPVV